MKTFLETRRSFIKKSAVFCAAFALSCGDDKIDALEEAPMKTKNPRKAIVLWYSQTGHTARIGRIIAKVWAKKGIKVFADDYRSIDKKTLGGFDLIVAGSPVYYLDVPGNFREWLGSVPRIDGTAVASYATFGGHGDNQHNTACAMIDILAGKGGVPAGIGLFSNMSTFAPTWSMGNEARILKYRNLPDEGTYRKAREFAAGILRQVADGKKIDVAPEFTMNTVFKKLPQIGISKLLVGTHSVDKNKCILCRRCEKSCPVNAIHPDIGNVERDKCIFCLGCVNNCPADAVVMTFLGKRVYGFNEFLLRNKITIVEPEELTS